MACLCLLPAPGAAPGIENSVTHVHATVWNTCLCCHLRCSTATSCPHSPGHMQLQQHKQGGAVRRPRDSLHLAAGVLSVARATGALSAGTGAVNTALLLCSVSRPLPLVSSRLVVSKIETPALHCTFHRPPRSPAGPPRDSSRSSKSTGPSIPACLATYRMRARTRDGGVHRRCVSGRIPWPFSFLGHCVGHRSKLRLRPSALRTSFGFN